MEADCEADSLSRSWRWMKGKCRLLVVWASRVALCKALAKVGWLAGTGARYLVRTRELRKPESQLGVSRLCRRVGGVGGVESSLGCGVGLEVGSSMAENWMWASM